jgi:hypothetical protein
MKKVLKWVFILLVLGIVVIQFFRPERVSLNQMTADDLNNKMQVPGNVQGILKRSCYDCHSNQTYWPWYSNVAPVSWLVADDVNNGRKKMNFSEWGKLAQSKQEKRLTDICDEITQGDMPLPKYLIIHKDAVLSQADKDAICGWINSLGIDSDSTDVKKDKK